MIQPVSQRKKSGDQVKAIKETQRASEQAMGAVISYLRSAKNPNSEEAHKLIDTVLEKYNCESPEGHIVAGGKQGAEPHEKGTGPIEREVPIVIDIYPRSKTTGYFADMSRTVCIGEPAAEVQKMYGAVLAAQALAISMIRPGLQCSKVQGAVEELFEEKGYKTSGTGKEFKFAEGFVHAVGHGIGLKLHEAPRVGRNPLDLLEEGDVITIEPALYYFHIGGIRIEDIILVTANGAENLTRFPKQFKI